MKGHVETPVKLILNRSVLAYSFGEAFRSQRFICSMDATLVDEKRLNETGKIDYRSLKPALFDFPTYEYPKTVDVLGKCLSFKQQLEAQRRGNMPKGPPELTAARKEEIIAACEKLYQTCLSKRLPFRRLPILRPLPTHLFTTTSKPNRKFF